MNSGIALALIAFFLGLVVGLPLCWVFVLSTAAALVVIGGSTAFVATSSYHALTSQVLMAIGFFILAGNVMGASKIAEHLVRFSYSLVWRVRGGLVDACVVAALFISALTGSASPALATLIPLMVPSLERYGYERRYVTAVIACSGFLGYLIPPSVPVLIYCLIAQQSVAAVFLSTVVPGLLIAGGYMVVNTFIVSRYSHPTQEAPTMPTGFVESLREIARTGIGAIPALGCPVVVLGGIYGGVFTPNEAGAVAAVYCILVGLYVYRSMGLRDVWQCAREAISILGMMAVLVAFSTVFTRLLIREGVAQSIAEIMLSLFASKWAILLTLNVFLLVMGMFLDGIPILLIAVPLVMPLVAGLGMNLIQLGAMIVVNVGVGAITPPYALSLFIGARLGGVQYQDLIKPMLWFLLLVALPVLFATTYVPAICCWLPTVVMGPMIVGAW